MITIDPTNLSPDYAQKLAKFFNTQASNIKVWKEGQIYTFEDGTEFEFTFDVVKRNRKEGKAGYRYEFISDRLLGKGKFGEVYEIEGTLAVGADDVLFKPHGFKNKTRAVKIQKHNAENPVPDALKEYNLAKEASHLGVKLPTIEGMTSYTVMKKLKGRELFDIIKDDYDGIQTLTLEQRFELTRLLLNALKEQVTDKGIIHRDIKGENIFVDLNSKPTQVNIFDFGLSVKADQLDGKSCGTPAYAPPEIFEGGRQTKKIDVFSLGRVIALLWRISPGSYGYDDIGDYYQNAKNVSLDSLFLNLNGISTDNQQIIRSMLEGMLRADRASRFKIKEAIALFSQVNLGNQITSSDQAKNKEPIAATLGLPPNSSTTKLLHKEPDFIGSYLEQMKQRMSQLTLPQNQSDLDDEQKLKLDALVKNLNTKIENLSNMVSTHSMQDFSTQIREAQLLIRENKSTFENYKAGYILANIGFGLLTIGIAHVALAAYSLYTGKNEFGFFKEIKATKSSTLCEEINESFENLNKNEL